MFPACYSGRAVIDKVRNVPSRMAQFHQLPVDDLDVQWAIVVKLVRVAKHDVVYPEISVKDAQQRIRLDDVVMMVHLFKFVLLHLFQPLSDLDGSRNN